MNWNEKPISTFPSQRVAKLVTYTRDVRSSDLVSIFKRKKKLPKTYEKEFSHKNSFEMCVAHGCSRNV